MSTALLQECSVSSSGDTLTLAYFDATFKYHAQWLHDSRCDTGPSRDSNTAFCQTTPTAVIQTAIIGDTAGAQEINVTWTNATVSRFPALWLRVLGPTVAEESCPTTCKISTSQIGWTPSYLSIPEYQYKEIFGNKDCATTRSIMERLLNDLLHRSAVGVVKIIGLPEAILDDERRQENTLLTSVLKQVFGSVFIHPRRGEDKSFNVAAMNKTDNPNPVALPSHKEHPVLLPHTDHAHYSQPARVMGLYQAEGISENTFVSSLAVLQTLKQEAPDLVLPLLNASVSIGRFAPYYQPPLNQATVDAAVTSVPGYPDEIKKVRWHPHLFGSLLCPFESYKQAREAHCKFQEISRRDSHQLKLILKPGDMYVWDNYRTLHGREQIMEVPRTGVGQTVPEEVVMSKYREVLLARLRPRCEEKWLANTPTAQLADMLSVISELESCLAPSLVTNGVR